MPCSIIKLVDVQEMNYLAAKGEGEVSNSKGQYEPLMKSWKMFFVPEITTNCLSLVKVLTMACYLQSNMPTLPACNVS